MLTVVSGASPTGMLEYGQRFLDTFHKHWPSDVRLLFYTEEPIDLPRGECRSLWDVPGAREFAERHRGNLAVQGKDSAVGAWKDRERASGYSYRFDAAKFFKQSLIPLDAARHIGQGLLCWLDADVVTHADVPAGFIESLLPPDKDVAYLGRGRKHSEIGFQLYRIPSASPMLERWAGLYTSDEFLRLKEWHSAYVWDRAREDSGVAAHDLTPGGSGHVFVTVSPLRHYLDHTKGDRKRLGRSPERRP